MEDLQRGVTVYSELWDAELGERRKHLGGDSVKIWECADVVWWVLAVGGCVWVETYGWDLFFIELFFVFVEFKKFECVEFELPLNVEGVEWDNTEMLWCGALWWMFDAYEGEGVVEDVGGVEKSALSNLFELLLLCQGAGDAFGCGSFEEWYGDCSGLLQKIDGIIVLMFNYKNYL